MTKSEILAQLQSGDAAAQRQAIRALQEGGEPDREVISQLDNLLRGEQTQNALKLEIMALFGKLNPETVLESVKWARHNIQDFLVRKQAFEILERSFTGDEVDRLVFVVKHHIEAQECLKAVRSLLQHRGDSRVATALRATVLTHSDPTVRQTAAEVLIDVQGEACVPLLTNAIIGDKVSHYLVTSYLRRKKVPFDGKQMMERIRQNAPQAVLDSIEQVGRNMSNR